MASTIKVNNIQNQCGANIANKCGTTITLGASGDTVTLASGASQSGFGRTGTVDWDTTAKTSSFTAVNGDGFFTNTTSAAFTATLPASPSAGDIVAFADYANTWGTNSLTLGRNGSNIEGDASDFICNIQGATITLVYVDATKGWVLVNSGNSSQVNATRFVTATGGTETTCGDYKIHTFTSPGTFCVSCSGNSCGSNTVDYLVVAGGGGGANVLEATGGGGAGGYRESSGAASGCYTVSPLGACVSALPVSATAYPVTVGAGGAAGAAAPDPGNPGSDGANSVFSTITSTGGGGGGAFKLVGRDGGSGGGGGARTAAAGGSGNTPPVSPPQGNPGGASNTPNNGPEDSSGGGGGALAAGGNGTNPAAGSGGNGATSSINATPTTRAGGGGGASQSGTGGSGGSGGGGTGGTACSSQGTAGTANTGGGGGGSVQNPGTNGDAGSGPGGSGIVIIRYKYQ